MFKDHPAFDRHHLVTARSFREAGLTAIIAVHDVSRGPALGGCRMFPYTFFHDALTDVLRLSKGMTYKAAIAGIPYGGGKAVIVGDPQRDATTPLFHAMGRFVDSLRGDFITTFDSGTTLCDVRAMNTQTPFTTGTLSGATHPSESTADGVIGCMKSIVGFRLGRKDLSGLRVAVQGAGSVGGALILRLRDAGARVWLSDVNNLLAERVAAATGATVTAPDDIHKIEADVFSPNAFGAVLNAETIPELGASIVVGAANNQLATAEDDMRLKQRGVTYCPDYVVNAGGIINLHYQRSGWSPARLSAHIDTLAKTCRAVVERADNTGLGAGAVADTMAQERIRANTHAI